jgi:hypothetical protein
MAEIHIVTSGYYSEYHICAVFSNEKNAEKYLKLMNDKEGNIETFTIDKWDVNKIPEGYIYWVVYFDRKGKILSVEKGYFDDGDLNGPKNGEMIVYSTGNYEFDIFTQPHEFMDMRISVWAKGEDDAVKIAREYRTIIEGSHPEFIDNIRTGTYFHIFPIRNGEVILEDKRSF